MEAEDPLDLVNAYEILSTADIYLGRVNKVYAEDISAGVFNGISNVNKKFVKYEFPSMIMSMSRSKSSRSTRKNALKKIGKITHSSSKGASNLLWFYSAIASTSKENKIAEDGKFTESSV